MSDIPIPHFTARVTAVAAALQSDGWLVLPDFLDVSLQTALLTDAEQRRGEFVPAAVGRGSARRLASGQRRDATLWLDAAVAVQGIFLQAMDAVRAELSRRLFLGLCDYEAHYAHYAPGAFYRRHRDTFAPATGVPVTGVAATGLIARPRRILSSVFYLNTASAGCELALWPRQNGGDGREVARIAAVAGSAVFFLSAEFPHAVLPAQSDCYLIAGWFRGR